MPVEVDAILAAGHELAQLYREAVAGLNLHWPDEDGFCIAESCTDEPYPCPAVWLTERAITGIEARWRREGRRLAELRQEQDPAAVDAAGDKGTGEQMSSLDDVKFRRSSACDNSGGSCLEVAVAGDTIITRDSKDPQGTVQAYTRSEWTAFIDGVKQGEFDL